MMYALAKFASRNLKVFLKDRANVFFSLLAPLIVLALYVLFLGRLQSDGMLASLEEMNVTGAEDAVRAFCDSWMLVGVMASASITVPLCACGIMVQDKSRGISADLLASPVPRWLPPAAYFLSVVAAGLVIGVIVLAVCFVWLAASGSWFLSFADVLGCIGTLLLSVLSSSTMLVFVVGFFRSQGAFTGLNVIFGTLVGFLIGAYMPISYFPEGVQLFTLFIPGSYSAGLFRSFMLSGALDNIAQTVSAPFAEALAEEFSMTYDFFGLEVGAPGMAAALAVSAALFAAADVAVQYILLRRAKRPPRRNTVQDKEA